MYYRAKRHPKYRGMIVARNGRYWKFLIKVVR